MEIVRSLFNLIHFSYSPSEILHGFYCAASFQSLVAAIQPGKHMLTVRQAFKTLKKPMLESFLTWA